MAFPGGLAGRVADAEQRQHPAGRDGEKGDQRDPQGAAAQQQAEDQPADEPGREADEALRDVGLRRDPREAQVLILALADPREALAQRAPPPLGAAARHERGGREQTQSGDERQPREHRPEAHSGSFARLSRRGGTRMEFSSRTTEWRTRNAVESSSNRAMATSISWPPPW